LRVFYPRLLDHKASDLMVVGYSRFSCPSRSAAHLAAVLFPKLPLWRAPLDDLME